MPESWERTLARWLSAALIDAATATRIREFESRNERGTGFRWPILVAVALGVVALGAGVLLFVSAHWDELSPSARMALVLLLVGVFHLAGAFSAGRFETMAVALHAAGTIALGAGIALTGQIFHLEVHWPAGFMLWAAGAVLAWLALRQWPQAAIASILIPYWLGGEWWVAMENAGLTFAAPMLAGLFLLAVTYLAAPLPPGESSLRRALTWIGGAAILPAAFALWWDRWRVAPSWEFQLAGWALAIAAPLVLAVLLRRRAALLFYIPAAAWAMVVVWINATRDRETLLSYPWYALGSVALIAWGVREQRIERINLGIAAFAITVLGFYFSTVMDKLGRSASLIGLGILFLAGGWALERTRRRLVAQIREAQ